MAETLAALDRADGFDRASLDVLAPAVAARAAEAANPTVTPESIAPTPSPSPATASPSDTQPSARPTPPESGAPAPPRTARGSRRQKENSSE
jgi:hypothetical protein